MIYTRTFVGGWRALPSGAILWGSVALAGQGLLVLGQRQRLEWALAASKSQPLTKEDGNSSVSSSSLLNTPGRNMTKFRFLGTDERPTVAGTKWDPAKDFFEKASAWIASKVNLPPWASPFVNAVDIEYRRKLNFSIELLEGQVRDLRKELRDKETLKK
jgi:hypothetical protein